MSVSFKDFLESAEALLKNTDSQEIDFRNLISRSYYAMFHLSKEISETLVVADNNEFRKTGSHEKIFNKFEKSSNKNHQRIAEIMYKCRDNRVKADYLIDQSIGRADAAHHFYAIKGIIQKLEQLKTNP